MLGDKIKKLRKATGMTQQELANAVNVKRSTIGMLESNKQGTSNDTLIKLAKILNTTIDYLLSDDTEEQLIDNSNNIEINVSKEYTYTHKASLLGDNIKRIRLSKGIGLNEVARRANITGGYLSSIENNKRTNIGAEILEAIANAIGVSVSDFYTNSENSIKTNENNIAMNACNKLKAHNELTLGENLKNIMKEKGVTSKELAERVGVSQVHISYILNNKRDPSVDLLEKIADILNVSVSDFYLGEISENKIDSDIVRIERARNKMPQEDKENMMRVLEAAFGKYFKD
ncbi:helix-turn-helix domain-containing protein [Clostridium neonatale]|uniref:HTH cro/C1-type domain-containing protein n=1 Tax=Clostridium neonatale TaxID=137838 RepID=A0AAD1YB22_9CLOT|nr:helix-turn-helix transcriptional regulator [Clostridium neonatale]CAG9717653.1 hypothetical protein CNEO_500007 [Clostridium neonatale]CAI3192153.1 hypothetical protein CNEO2_1040007 [Clostridium neonatale]CAI3192936.1 hypothetical protein CNEO2_1100007 [Clostridium neonatale]CAI3196623.1 hypothetical protein CNEO2_1470007 [Clostridium neonatale]CAI3216917.1 hypothetical protein CNEO2_1040008 [Clostridium neonatale]